MTVLPPLAEVEDLAVILLRPLLAEDGERAAALLDDASGIIRAEANGTTWVDSDGTITAPPQIVTLCKNVAKRAFINPAGYWRESVGEWSGQFADRDQISSGVYLTDPERKLIQRAIGKTGLGTLQITRWPEPYPVPVYVEIEGGGEKLPVDPPWAP